MNKLLVQMTVEELKNLMFEVIKPLFDGKKEVKSTELKVYRRKEVAKLFGVSVQTINAWVKQGKLPKPTKIGRVPVFTEEQFKEMLDSSLNT